MRTLIIGGARSGKTGVATRWADERSANVCCVVTAIAVDEEMHQRIAAHRAERPTHWATHEAPVQLAAAVREELAPGRLLLVDCLTIWTSNCLWPTNSANGPHVDMTGWRAERNAFLATLRDNRDANIIIVTNEVGTGIVPDNAAARLFRDEQGWLNQAVAALCDEVFLVTAGLALRLK